jgi:uncharacterized protein YhaN
MRRRMAIRIDRIKVNRGGPLERDFELETGDLNLIYGRNETGKTYVVESVIGLLFKTGGRTAVGWNLRGWDIAGRVIVSGLTDDQKVTFTKTGEKLEDYWGGDFDLPQDFSRLLVVKAGENRLVGEADDGVGRDILKNYLSGVGILDRIAEGISATLRDATVQDHRIEGAQRGEVKQWNQLREELGRIDDLLGDIEDGYSSGLVFSLDHEKERIEGDLAGLERARRYHASRMCDDIRECETDLDQYPDEEELSNLESLIQTYEIKKGDFEQKSSERDDLSAVEEEFRWLESALEIYQYIMKGEGVSRPTSWIFFLGLLLLAGAIISGLIGQTIPLVLGGVGSVAVILYYFVEIGKALTNAGKHAELENLETDYRERYGAELTGETALRTKVKEVQENHFRSKSLQKDLYQLKPEINSLNTTICEQVRAIAGSELSFGEWRDAIREVRNRRKEVEKKLNEKREQLASLGIEEAEYLEQDPGIEWDVRVYSNLNDELEKTKGKLEEEIGKLDQLKSRVSQETHSKSANWEELITALRNRREEKATEYRQLVASMLAKVQVNTVIEEFRELENSRIEEGLGRRELVEPLQSITGCYRGVRYDEGSGLVLITGEDEEFPLADLSTGAREQVFLALRMGFASLAMKDRTAFLILDDAFQHSDWLRRENLIAKTLALVNAGWQVFYFTMDDHIRDLFIRAAGNIEGRFEHLDLS